MVLMSSQLNGDLLGSNLLIILYSAKTGKKYPFFGQFALGKFPFGQTVVLGCWSWAVLIDYVNEKTEPTY